MVEGLGGAPLGDGLGGRWVQAYYVHALVAAAGGNCDATMADEAVTFRAFVPA